jgi:hypothetical protein
MNQTQLYVYGCRNRPPYEAAPEGRLVALDSPKDERANYGAIVYPHQLTPREIYGYELIPLEPEPVHPAYREGATVKDMRSGKPYTVEYDGLDWWVGDNVMNDPLDWIFYEQVAER